MGGKSGQTIGYKFYMSLLSGLCRGPIDEIRQIKVGDFLAWDGHGCGGGLHYIDAPDLFGGDRKEGGIQGPFRIQMGAPDQVLPGAEGTLPDVKASIGTGLVSQMRGVCTVWFDGLVASMNPYLKTWKFRVRRAKKGWFGGTAWYEDKAVIYLGGDVLTATKKGDAMSVVLGGSSATVTFSSKPNEGDTLTINGVAFSFVAKLPTDGSSLTEHQIVARSSTATMASDVAAYINDLSATLNATAIAAGSDVVITLAGGSGTIHAMNGAHICYETLTNPEWGRGLDPALLNENSFIYGANTLCAEGFGLCIIWYRKENIDVFLQKVCDIVGASIYTDRETGLVTFKLIRADYDINDLPLFTPSSGLLSILEDDSASSDNSYNEIIGTGHDPITDQDFQVRAQNLAAYQSQGSASSFDPDYTGVPTKALLGRVVLRDLKLYASGLKKYTVNLDRRAWRLAPGMAFRISDPRRGIANLVLRAGEIDDGDMVNGQIKIKALVDVFSLPENSYVQPVGSSWTPPTREAVPSPDTKLTEVSYRDFLLIMGASSADAVDADTGYIGQLALAPNSSSYQYDLASHADGEDYEDRVTGSFTGNAKLTADIAPLDTAITLTDASNLTADNIGQALLVNDELIRLDDLVGDVATVTRGTGDTIPQAHLAGARVWTIDDDLISDKREYDTGETVYAKVLTRTSSQVLDLANAAEESTVIAGRVARPYPPADVQVDGVSIYSFSGEHNEPVLTWVDRNRLTQGDHLVGHTEATVAPEAGTTYTIRIYKHDGTTLLQTYTGIAALTWTYTSAMQATDGAISTIILELVSVRDGLESYQPYRIPIALQSGFGYGYGYDFGG